MNHDEIMELIIEHYRNPRNRGPIENASAVQKGGNPGCGDLLTVYVDADDEGVVRRLRFEGDGCMVSQAGASIILEKAEGKTLTEIEGMPPGIMSGILGERLVMTRPACAQLGLNTLKLAVRKLLSRDARGLERGEARAE